MKDLFSGRRAARPNARRRCVNLLAGFAVLVVSGLISAAPVRAACEGQEPCNETERSGAFWWLEEIRGGVLYHEDSRLQRLLGRSSKPHEDGYVDLNGEIVTVPLRIWQGDGLAGFLFNPRIATGATVHLGDGTSHAYAMLVWQKEFFERLFVEAGLGVGVHNGAMGPNSSSKRALGCNPLFRNSASVGWNLTDRWRIMLSVEHLDNFNHCDYNAQLTNLGIRIGYRM